MTQPAMRPVDVVLCHFGGPEKANDVEPFLRELFEDPFIIRLPLGGPLRRFLARRIAKKRAPESTQQYQQIGFSPINRYTAAQAAHLQALLDQQLPGSRVLVINRYTAPRVDAVLPDLTVGRLPEQPRSAAAWLAAEPRPVFFLSLYPHFCHSTTASSYREIDWWLRQRDGHLEGIHHKVYTWWQQPEYLDYGCRVLLAKLEELVAQDARPITVVASAHGIPVKYDVRGDPYSHEIRAHFSALRERACAWLAERAPDQDISWHLAFQSRVGPVRWLEPATEALVPELARARGGRLLVWPISFVSDHIETLFELDIQLREAALQAGFAEYHKVPMPNDDPDFARVLLAVLERHGLPAAGASVS